MKIGVNPLYGKKGMGLINNPKKAMYSKVYNKTTVGVSDVVRIATSSSKSANKGKAKVRQLQDLKTDVMSLERVYKNRFIGWTLFSVVGFWVLIFPVFLAELLFYLYLNLFCIVLKFLILYLYLMP